MILVIDNYDSFTFNLVHYLMELGAETRVVRNDALTAAEAIAMAPQAVLLSPGPCTPNEAGISLDLVAAAADADWKNAPGFQLILTNQGTDQAWPIAAATFILVQKNPANKAGTQEALKFFDWAYKNGNAAATRLDYVPLPEATKNQIRQTWKEVQ